MLLWEKRKGDTSPRAGLLADLPASHDPPWRWDPKSLALLHYNPLAYAVSSTDSAGYQRSKPVAACDCMHDLLCTRLQALQQRAQWRQALADLHSKTPGEMGRGCLPGNSWLE